MKVLILLAIVAAATSLDVKVRQKCDDVDNSFCTVNAIRIEPCENPTKCTIVRNNNATISFDFTPNFTSNDLLTDVTYTGISWPALDTNGCEATSCPTVPGTMQTYSKQLHIGKMTPKGSYGVEWSVYDANNSTLKCCFTTTLVIKAK